MLDVTRKLVVLGLIAALQACTQIDDYLLGKDNTPKPPPLGVFQSKLSLAVDWSVQNSRASKSSAYLKLKPTLRGNTLYTANASGSVQAVNKTTGSLIWSKQLSQGVVSGPTVAEGYVAIGTNRSSVILLRESDGIELQRLRLTGDSLSKPVIKNHKIIVKTIDGNVYAFDLKTGKKLWVSEHGAPSLILKASSSPVIRNGLVIVGFSDGKLDAIDLETGRVVWQRSIAFASGSSDVERLVDIDADPIVRSPVIYLASYQGYVGALSLTDGQFVWRKPASVYKNMAIDAGTLFITDSDDVVWAINRANGQVKWKQLSLKARGLTEPVLIGHRLLVGDRMGYLHVLSDQNGELLARQQLSGPIDIAPVVSGNTIFIMTANGKLNRLSLG